ncbi:hypothetical protein [Ruegeria sp. HKCCA5426]|uniref:hypothetical protein n=1 Tax=Ruegeria sp. HKCCA5426 TaxID=2682985 RepID=UPI001489C818|nr:hypothetical protein [Ruegeria sp. HKCCA5426]
MQSRYEACLKSILLDLFRAHLSDPTLEVGIGTGTTYLQGLSKSRYGASFISARTFTDAIEALQKAGLVLQSTAYWHDPAGKNSRTARYMPTPELLSGLKQTGATIVDLQRNHNAEGIRLKDSDKALVEYGDNAFATAARERLRIINDMLASHWADLALSDEQLAEEVVHIRGTRDEEATQSFDFASRTVYRVFNNSDWQQGGRFYGAWWISCPSRLRPHILIDGKRTVEVDYSGLHAAMLYAEAGMDVPEDPYARCISKSGDKAERRLVKRTFNALLNADKVNRVSEIEGYTPVLTGRDWPEFKQYIVARYPEFSQHFGSGVGLKLQRKDSDLAEAVMLKFAAMGYACLPVHDSFVVHHDLEQDLANAMNEAFRAEFGVDGNVGVEVGVGETVEGSRTPIDLDIGDLLHLKSFEERLSDFRSTKCV